MRGGSSFPAAALELSGLLCGASTVSGSVKPKEDRAQEHVPGLLGTIHYSLATSRAHIYFLAA